MFRIVTPSREKPFTIGRKEGSDLHFPERFVSREHAIIECKETEAGVEWHIKSLTTNSFTLLNDVQVTESEIHDGDIIGIGVKQAVLKGKIDGLFVHSGQGVRIEKAAVKQGVFYWVFLGFR